MRNGVTRCQTHQCGRTECVSCAALLWTQVPGLHRTSLPAPLPASLICAQVWSGYCMFTQTATQKVGNRIWSLSPSSVRARLLLYCPAQHPIPHELTTSTSAPVSAVLGTLCFRVDHSNNWVPFVEIRNGPYSVLNPSAVFILRGLRTYTREWTNDLWG